jgi:hypothetical protein
MNPKITHDISSNHEHDHVKVHGKKKEDIRLLIVGAGGIGC